MSLLDRNKIAGFVEGVKIDFSFGLFSACTAITYPAAPRPVHPGKVERLAAFGRLARLPEEAWQRGQL